jgi:DNA-binding transcriptional LysR family regulator
VNLNHLRVFASVANAGNLTRAAHNLRVSQPAVSKQLADLEADVGTQLFDRLPRGVRLTAAGQVLYAHAERILRAEQAATSELEQLRNLGQGRLSIGASTTIGSYLVPSLFGALHQRHPGVQLDLQIANSAAISAAVLDNRIDLGLTEGLAPTDAAALSAQTIAHDEMVVIAAPKHPALARAPMTARKLLDLPLLMREPGSGTREVIEAALLAKGLRADPAMSLGGTEALKNAVLHGLGIAIVSRLTVEHELRSVRLAELVVSDLRIRRELQLLLLKGKRTSPAANAFVELLLQRQRDQATRALGESYSI